MAMLVCTIHNKCSSVPLVLMLKLNVTRHIKHCDIAAATSEHPQSGRIDGSLRAPHGFQFFLALMWMATALSVGTVMLALPLVSTVTVSVQLLASSLTMTLQ